MKIKRHVKKLKTSLESRKDDLDRFRSASREELKKLASDFKDELRSFRGPVIKEFAEIAQELGSDVKELALEPVKAAKRIRDKKYEYIIKRLGLKPVKEEYKKKLLIIQIDGLSHEALSSSIKKGYCKNMRKLLNEGYNLQKFNCGMPSMTPTFQAGILYGENDYVSGFRFIDKKLKRDISFSNISDSQFIEETRFKNKKGLLEKGSSYANIFSGGAERTVLTLSTMGKHKGIERISKSDAMALLFLNPLAGSKSLYHAIREFIVDILELVVYKTVSLFKRGEYFPFVLYFPFKRILFSAVAREVMTIGCILDIKRGSPRIYINYNGYDELSHYRGPTSRSSLMVLREIDIKLGQLLRDAKDDYDIYLLSDHGHTDSMPFNERYGMSLGELVDKSTSKDIKSIEITNYNEEWPYMILYGLKKIGILLWSLSKPISFLLKSVLHMVIKSPESTFTKWSDGDQVFVLDNSSIAQLYFNFSTKKVSLSQIKKKYPYLIKNLVHHPGIGLVVGREGKNVVVMGKRGKVVIGKKINLRGKDVLSEFGDYKIIAKQLEIMANMETAGDLILMGAYEDGKVISFTGHIGSHGGIGGPQNWPFFITDKDVDVTGVYHPAQLYHYFKEYL